jgi:hypothetical protein
MVEVLSRPCLVLEGADRLESLEGEHSDLGYSAWRNPANIPIQK